MDQLTIPFHHELNVGEYLISEVCIVQSSQEWYEVNEVVCVLLLSVIQYQVLEFVQYLVLESLVLGGHKQMLEECIFYGLWH